MRRKRQEIMMVRISIPSFLVLDDFEKTHHKFGKRNGRLPFGIGVVILWLGL